MMTSAAEFMRPFCHLRRQSGRQRGVSQQLRIYRSDPEICGSFLANASSM